MNTQLPSTTPLARLARLVPGAFAALVVAGLVAALTGVGQAEEAAPAPPADWRAVGGRIDGLIEAQLDAAGVVAAPRSSDSEFLRRLYLDLVGTVPTPEEVATFTADTTADKRARKIDELLQSDAYAEHQASFWFRTLTGMSVHQGRQREGQGGRYVTGEGGKQFHRWLATQVAEGRPYNEMVEALISATGRTDENGAAGYIARWENDANNSAGAVARHFLGVQIQCAQCHDHIYEPDWKQKDFEGMAAFFATTRVERVPEYRELRQIRDKLNKQRAEARKAGEPTMEGDEPSMDGAGRPEMAGRMGSREAREAIQKLRKYANIVTVTDRAIDGRRLRRQAERMKQAKNPQIAARAQLLATTPKFWMGAEAADLAGIPRRYLLARWVTSDENPYFARTLVNRMWGHFMGRGIVDPVDDFNSFQTPSHPEVLRLLAEDFKTHGYDLRRVQRILLNTETYQRTSRWTEEEKPDPALFAKAPVRPLDTEQLYFALTRATGVETALNRTSRRQQQAIQQAIFSVFTFVFDDDEGKAEEDFSGSIPQGLFLMNGELLQRALSGGRAQPQGRAGRRGRGPARMRQRPAQSMLEQLLREEPSDEARVEQLYLRAYGRTPQAGERRDAVAFVKEQGGGPQAYEDLFWAILNSAEFMTNH